MELFSELCHEGMTRFKSVLTLAQGIASRARIRAEIGIIKRKAKGEGPLTYYVDRDQIQ